MSTAPFVASCEVDGPVPVDDWATIYTALLSLRGSPHSVMLLSGGRTSLMTIEHAVDWGYYISAFADGELDEWIAFDRNLPSETVPADLSGYEDYLPRSIFLDQRCATQVLQTFYWSGWRDGSVGWMRSTDLMR